MVAILFLQVWYFEDRLWICTKSQWTPMTLPPVGIRYVDFQAVFSKFQYPRSCRQMQESRGVMLSGWYMIQPPGLATPRPLYCDFDIRITTSYPTGSGPTNGLTLMWWGCPDDPFRDDYATNPFYFPSPPLTSQNVWPGSDVFLSMLSDSTHTFWIDMNSIDGGGVPSYYISNDVSNGLSLQHHEFLSTHLSPNAVMEGAPETTFFDASYVPTITNPLSINSNDPNIRSFPESAWDTGSNPSGFHLNAIFGCSYEEDPMIQPVWRVYIW